MFDFLKIFMIYLQGSQQGPGNIEDLEYKGCLTDILKQGEFITQMVKSLSLSKLDSFRPDEFQKNFEECLKVTAQKKVEIPIASSLQLFYSNIQLLLLDNPFSATYRDLFEVLLNNQLLCTDCGEADDISYPNLTLAFDTRKLDSLESSFETMREGEIIQKQCSACGNKTDTLNRLTIQAAPCMFFVDVQRMNIKLKENKVNYNLSKFEFKQTLDLYEYSEDFINEEEFEDGGAKNKNKYKYELKAFATRFIEPPENKETHTIYLKKNEDQWISLTVNKLTVVPASEVVDKFFVPHNNQIAVALFYVKENISEQSVSVFKSPETTQFIQKYLDIELSSIPQHINNESGKKYYQIKLKYLRSLFDGYLNY